ncbi:MAG: 4Fe-4S binding protein [Candidatus Saganbacteria bacterium]|nr:4Fe-4S binding protein [Candidatus Saganbacteria bacterium]
MRRLLVSKKLGWKELPFGDSIKAGTAEQFETGDWRSLKPIWYADRCIHCMRCWINCPDSSIEVKDGKMTGIDLKHCKGCGICAFECPVKKPGKAITMEAER